MRKLVIGITAVALLGLLAVPAMAQLDTAEVPVSINVLEYGAIEFNPDPTLSFDVEGPYDVEPPPAYGDSITFTVLCNLDTTLTVTVPVGETSHATAAPGTPDVSYYPTAHTTGGDRIGFGVALTNLTTNEYGPWNEEEDGNAAVSFGVTQRIDIPGNARITVNSYMDSARDGNALAPVGVYEQTLTLTLSAP